MKQLIFALAVVMGFSGAARADTYRWVDDKGVVNFTDNPDLIPSKYRKRVRKSPSMTNPAPSPESEPESRPQRQSKPPVNKSDKKPTDSLSEQEWRSRFATLRAELKALQDGLPKKREALNQLHRKRTIYQRPQDRAAYNEQMDKIERDEARIKELEAQLSALDNEASRAGVPFEWRK
ncbi:hypothetical protein GeomeDRAFT_2677 [Geobacter metallireducens RCH3]|uniref:DUF4124 domain-containing protein n=1 Tax=Geobacter metallireducens (strain ATCC 53774 / DSM 7210 / GS-15) TaxID=269799 RepID=Q39TZ8_GEOMG|nr:DUF4124 domain-containing protein [Geobacter metallireducens]ABB32276.1 protein of unknown function, DUF4124-containing [Geobacter metallireducens GS-15]EHP85166.1 hypothetical protein GeomeDRAFT_2677 [Geobacter metallireducens RCH3]